MPDDNQNTTHYAFEISTPQERALLVLLEGGTVIAAARAAGVNRGTVHGWRINSPEFIAAYNRERDQIYQAHRAQLDSLAELAISAVRSELEAGNAKIGIEMLRGLGLLNGERDRIGPTTPADAESQIEYEQLRSLTAMPMLSAVS